MGLKDIGKKTGNAAFRLALSSCGCGRECSRCGSCHNPPSSEPEFKKRSHGKNIGLASPRLGTLICFVEICPELGMHAKDDAQSALGAPSAE